MRKRLDDVTLNKIAWACWDIGLTFEEDQEEIEEHLRVIEHMMFDFHGCYTLGDIDDHRENLHYLFEDIVAIEDRAMEDRE